ncbi:MAG TPA: glutamate formimidoyltransferase [Candidatus Eisenbacteria bacterium]|nr:glutamate formimidoyltransferase [Candidatus Eisenbacteria bacterium]
MAELIECVPNFSEGRNKSVVTSIAAEISRDRSIRLLDQEMNADHNRSVVTFVGEPEAVLEAAVRAVRTAAELIDLRKHQGEHPRMGATDVLPFVPVGSSKLDRCVELARRAGERIGTELGIPVYLYEGAATRPSRQNLADVRRGEFEGIAKELGTNPDRAPDFGPNAIHPSAGAIAVGARLPLLAFNVNLGTRDVEVAKRIAKAIRFQTGGLRYVKALGFELHERGIVQVSMNLVNTWGTPVHRVFAMIREEAERYGVPIVGSEVVGLVCQDALIDVAEHSLRLERFSRDQILENRLARHLGAAEQAVPEFLDEVASSAPTPGGGSVAALAGSLAAALATMVARLTIGKKRYAEHDERMRGVERDGESLRRELFELVAEDAKAYDGFVAAAKMSQRTPEETASREKALADAARNAAAVPLRTAETCVRALELAAAVAEVGNQNAVSDAGVAAWMARGGAEGAALNVAINLPSVPAGDRAQLEARTRAATERAAALHAGIVERVRARMAVAAGT